MALPKLSAPKYKLKLPSDGRTVNYRPFLVKEEKLLLLATETGEQADLITAIKDIIAACTDIKDIEKLSTFDIEFVFLQIRTKSVGESIDLNVTCPDDGETQVEVSIPLADIKVIKTKGHKKDIKLTDEVMISMGYPSLDTFVKINFTDETRSSKKGSVLIQIRVRTLGSSYGFFKNPRIFGVLRHICFRNSEDFNF